MKYIALKSKSCSRKVRNTKKIKHLIIHYTGMQSIRASIKRLTAKKYKVSCHYLIGREGKIYQMISDNKVAWHAGKSQWKKTKNLNESSIGIELVNKGHKFGYQKFPPKQIKTLIQLCLRLKKKYKIKNKFILGHSDIAPLRKIDPGEKFPWSQLKQKNLGIWYALKKKQINYSAFDAKKSRNFFFNNLFKFGYRYFNLDRIAKSDKIIIKAFQSRFRQNKVNGLIDPECLKISHLLSKNK